MPRSRAASKRLLQQRQEQARADEYRRRHRRDLRRTRLCAASWRAGVFCLSRAVGILSHAWEQRGTQRAQQRPMPRQMAYTYTGQARASFADCLNFGRAPLRVAHGARIAAQAHRWRARRNRTARRDCARGKPDRSASSDRPASARHAGSGARRIPASKYPPSPGHARRSTHSRSPRESSRTAAPGLPPNASNARPPEPLSSGSTSPSRT